MLRVRGSTEPDRVTLYFDKRGWSGESRSHAEVVEVFRPRQGWKRMAGHRRVSRELLEVLSVEGITKITLRVRYSGSRVVSADFNVSDLLRKR